MEAAAPVGTLGYGDGVSGKLTDESVLEGFVRHMRRKTKVLPAGWRAARQRLAAWEAMPGQGQSDDEMEVWR